VHCRTITDTAFAFCYVCGAQYPDSVRVAPHVPPTEGEARRDGKLSAGGLAILGALGLLSLVRSRILAPAEVWQSTVLTVLIVVGLGFGILSTIRKESRSQTTGEFVGQVARIALYVGICLFVAAAGLYILFFALCSVITGKR
jgi:hypothetical protein